MSWPRNARGDGGCAAATAAAASSTPGRWLRMGRGIRAERTAARCAERSALLVGAGRAAQLGRGTLGGRARGSGGQVAQRVLRLLRLAPGQAVERSGRERL